MTDGKKNRFKTKIIDGVFVVALPLERRADEEARERDKSEDILRAAMIVKKHQKNLSF